MGDGKKIDLRLCSALKKKILESNVSLFQLTEARLLSDTKLYKSMYLPVTVSGLYKLKSAVPVSAGIAVSLFE